MNAITIPNQQEQLALPLETSHKNQIVSKDLMYEIFALAVGINQELHLVNKKSYLIVKNFHKELFNKIKLAFKNNDYQCLNKIKKILFDCKFFCELHYTVQTLINKNCNIETGTPLFPNFFAKSISEGNLKKVQIAIELGSDVNNPFFNYDFQSSFYSIMPLIGAVTLKRINVATYLMSKDAHPDQRCPSRDFYCFLDGELQVNEHFLEEEPDFLSGFQYNYFSWGGSDQIVKLAIEKNKVADLIYQQNFKTYDCIHQIFDPNQTGGIILTYLDPKKEVFDENNPSMSQQEYYRRLFELKYDVKFSFMKFF